MSFRLELEQPAVPDSVPLARFQITGLCEELCLEEELTARIRLAVTEACTNCVLHAYGAGARPGGGGRTVRRMAGGSTGLWSIAKRRVAIATWVG